MEHHFLLRSHSDTHDQASQDLSPHPTTVGRILIFALPFLYAIILIVALLPRNLKIHQNYFIRAFPARTYIYVALFIGLVGGAIAGIEAVIDDAWTTKEWTLFAVTFILLGLEALIYVIDSKPTILIAGFVTILTAISNQWLFISLTDMSQATQSSISWKHVDRNFIGFIEASLIILAILYISQSLAHGFGVRERHASIFFWIVGPLVIMLVFIWDVVSFGPFLDTIGYIVASIIMFLGAAVNTLLFLKQEIEPLRK